MRNLPPVPRFTIFWGSFKSIIRKETRREDEGEELRRGEGSRHRG